MRTMLKELRAAIETLRETLAKKKGKHIVEKTLADYLEERTCKLKLADGSMIVVSDPMMKRIDEMRTMMGYYEELRNYVWSLHIKIHKMHQEKISPKTVHKRALEAGGILFPHDGECGCSGAPSSKTPHPVERALEAGGELFPGVPAPGEIIVKARKRGNFLGGLPG